MLRQKQLKKCPLPWRSLQSPFATREIGKAGEKYKQIGIETTSKKQSLAFDREMKGLLLFLKYVYLFI